MNDLKAENAAPAEWDWVAFLERASQEWPRPTYAIEAVQRAKEWPTCAVGQLCRALPRHPNGEPMDARLADMGEIFAWRIQRAEWESALTIFRQIEVRTSELLAALGKPDDLGGGAPPPYRPGKWWAYALREDGIVKCFWPGETGSREEAEAVCESLRRDGFDGKRQEFPVRTWVKEVVPANPDGALGGASRTGDCALPGEAQP